ncbi:MAG: hypothetical protein ABSH14_14755 [Verrucomicrobiia bacterium]|jgi:hypothetical protein
MKLALAIGLGVFVIGFSTGNSQEVDRDHLASTPVAVPAGFEKAVANSQEVDRTHLSGTPVPAPAGFEKAVEEAARAHAEALRPVPHVEPPPMTSREVARAAAAVRTSRRCEAKHEPRDTSRAVLNTENAALERPMPRTNFFGRE